MLVNKTEYLTAGVHIGMKSCTPYMRQFVYKIRDDGLAVFNLQKVDDRIKVAADSGDFKLDPTPVDGRLADLARLGALASAPGVRWRPS